MAEDEVTTLSVSADTPETLAAITKQLVEQRLVACGNIVPQVQSIYRWSGATHDDRESVALLHTRRSLVPDVIRFVTERHPDETPQIIAYQVVDVHPGYRDWVMESTEKTR